MTGYESKRAAARDKLDDDRRAYYEKFDDLYAVYLNGVYDGKKAAQPEQEPVAWMHVQGNYKEPSFRELADDEVERGWKQYPLYTAPPQRPWVGLTDEELLQIRENLQVVEGISLLENLTKAIGAALRSKNT